MELTLQLRQIKFLMTQNSLPLTDHSYRIVSISHEKKAFFVRITNVFWALFPYVSDRILEYEETILQIDFYISKWKKEKIFWIYFVTATTPSSQKFEICIIVFRIAFDAYFCYTLGIYVYEVQKVNSILTQCILRRSKEESLFFCKFQLREMLERVSSSCILSSYVYQQEMI